MRSYNRYSAALRILALAAFALPLTSLFDGSPFSPPEYVLVLDDSPSMRARFPGFGEDVIGAWKGFAGGDGKVVIAGQHPAPPRGDDAVAGRYTDLVSALRSAAALSSSATEKRVLLVSDGLSQSLDLTDTLRDLKDRQVKVFALSPPAPVRQAGVLDFFVPAKAFLWEPFVIKGKIAASSRGPVTVVLSRNGFDVAEKEVIIDESGFGEVEFVQEADRVGTVLYSLAVKEYTSPAVAGDVRVARTPRVRYISDDPMTSEKLITLFRDAGIEVVVSRPPDILSGGEMFDSDDIIVLDDLPALAVGDTMVEMLAKEVGGKGKGLLVIGGRKGLGSESYRDSLLESILPVTVGYSSPPEPPPVSLVIAMDTSFSMNFRNRGESPFGGTSARKIDVARESVKEVLKVTRSRDRLGILGNSTDIFWIRALDNIRDRAEDVEKIDGIDARGGGINFYSIVSEAYQALRKDDSVIRHVIVFADSEDIDQYEVEGEGHSFDLVRSMAKEGITLSVLAIGLPTDKDVDFLRTATLLGGGDFYLISNLMALPRYFVSEYRKLSSRHFLEEQIRPMPGEHSTLLTGVNRSLPIIGGIAMLTARSGTETPIRTDPGVPLVTLGRYGKGRTAVFASDNGYRWAQSWLDWSLGRRFWLRLLFSVSPAGDDESRFSSLTADRYEDRITFHYRSESGSYPDWEKLWLHRRGDAGVSDTVELVRTGLMTYQSRAPLPEPGYYRYTLAGDEAGEERILDASLYIPSTVESLPYGEGWGLIDEILDETGGEWLSSPGDIVKERSFLTVRKEVIFILVIAVGMMFLVAEKITDMYLRR